MIVATVPGAAAPTAGATASTAANLCTATGTQCPSNVNESLVTSTTTDAFGRYSMRLASGSYGIGFFKPGPCCFSRGDLVLDLAVSGRDVTLNAQIP